MTPKVPICESFMMARVFSRDVPPPKPSMKSARPSSCRQPVSTIRTSSARIQATVRGKMWLLSQRVRAIRPPESQPTRGQRGTTRLKSSAGTSISRQKGSRVKKIKVASKMSISVTNLVIIRYLCMQ